MDGRELKARLEEITRRNASLVTHTITVECEGPLYRYPMTADTLAEDKAHYAENVRRRKAGEQTLPPLAPSPHEYPKRVFKVVKQD